MATLTVTTLDDEAFDGSETVGVPDGNGLSLREALALASDGDTITFDNSLSGGTLTLTNGQLDINLDDFTLDGDLDNDGDADIVIDANNASRVINISAGAGEGEGDPSNVLIDGLVITGGYLPDGFRGAGVNIGNDVSVTIYNSTVTGNTIQLLESGGESGGGGIYVGGASTTSLYVTNSVISNNTARLGGGISSYTNTTINISGSEISGNNAVLGGGVYVNGVTTINGGSSIYGNEASENGGGVYNLGQLTLNEGSFIAGNDAGQSGGGLYNGLSATANIYDGSIYLNEAADGAGVYSTGDLSIDNMTISDNVASNNGGGVYSTGPGSETTITNTTFRDNTALNGQGGGWQIDEPTAFGANNTFEDNRASYGGGVHLNSGSTTLTNTTFYSNDATYNGGAILTGAGAGLTIRNGTLTGNYAGGTGGGIFQDGDSFEISNSIVLGNFDSAGLTGGSADFGGGEGTLSFQGTNFFQSIGYGPYEPGITIVSDVSAVFAETTTQEGRTYGVLGDNGGPVETVAINPNGIAVDAGDDTELPTDSNDLDGDLNTGEILPVDARGLDRISGGTSDVGALEIQQFIVTTNADGGADNFGGGDLAAETADGGGLSLREALALAPEASLITFNAGMTITLAGTQLTITQDSIAIDGDLDNDGTADVTIDANDQSRVIQFTGGGGESNPGQLSLDGLVITEGNVTDANGGGILLNNDTETTITNSVISSNYLSIEGGQAFGGGIAVNGSSAVLRLYGSEVSGNYTQGLGGGVFNNGDAYLHDTTFSGNSANEQGGGIHNTRDLYIYGGSFDTNSSVSGGAIFNFGYSADATIEGTGFETNSSSLSGGAIVNYQGTLNADGASFTGNYSESGNGGAIAASEATTTIINSGFYGNSAGNEGGAIHNEDSDLGFANSLFSGNSAEGNGGAIDTNGANSELFSVNSTFYGNQATSGGAIYGDLTNNQIYNSTFTGNYASNRGGAFAHRSNDPNYTARVLNSIFSGNDAGVAGADIAQLNGTYVYAYGGNIVGGPGFSDAGVVEIADVASVFNETIINPYTGLLSGRLRDNGGPAHTAAPLPTGFAIGNGVANHPILGNLLPSDILDLDGDMNIVEDIPFDGRGDERVANGSLDIGAVELEITNGTNGADNLVGDGFSEIINAFASADIVMAGGGRDTVVGGDGDDNINGQAGADRLLGGSGGDTLVGGVGADTLAGGGGSDSLVGQDGNDQLFGGDGNDTLSG
ncbi:MAG: choice-of-anchor Q domain-containing protein, partial [Pseudomonadota bacterium]